MIREFRRHGFVKGWRVWWTWAAVKDIETISRETKARRWVWVHLFRQRLVRARGDDANPPKDQDAARRAARFADLATKGTIL